MNLNANRTRLERLTKDLLLEWDLTKSYWKDARSQGFEHRYLRELAAQVDRASAVIGKLDELLTKVRRDCE